MRPSRGEARGRPTGVAAAAVAALLVSCGSASAHPHQFIIASGAFLLDEGGRLQALRLTYAMDETESLYIASEFGLDPDGPLSEDEARRVADAYAEGYEQFGWFAEVRRGVDELELIAPRRSDSRMKDGVLEIDFELPLSRPADFDRPITTYLYDPTYYAAIEWDVAPTVVGPGAGRCEVSLDRYKPDAAAERLLQQLALLPPDETPDDPMVGRRFADRVKAECGDGFG